jgi:hypothetical protein
VWERLADDVSIGWLRVLHPLFGVSDLEMFLEESGENIALEYAEGFDGSSFVWLEGEPIPIILSVSMMEQRGVSLGDNIYIYNVNRENDPYHYPAQIIGRYRGTIPWRFPENVIRVDRGDGDGVIVHLPVLEMIQGRYSTYNYIDARFEIKSSKNRELDIVRETWESIMRDGQISDLTLALDINDEELRLVVDPLEQSLTLLQVLRPVVVAVALALGLGLSLLLMLTNTKNAAIMRVLGTDTIRTRKRLSAGQLLCCLLGVLSGFIIQYFAGWNQGGQMMLVIQASSYFIAVLTGTFVGAIVITRHTPLELLQVKE